MTELTQLIRRGKGGEAGAQDNQLANACAEPKKLAGQLMCLGRLDQLMVSRAHFVVRPPIPNAPRLLWLRLECRCCSARPSPQSR